MVVEKICDLPEFKDLGKYFHKEKEEECTDVEHNPAWQNLTHLEPGIYKNTCSTCGKVSQFTVPRIIPYTKHTSL